MELYYKTTVCEPKTIDFDHCAQLENDVENHVKNDDDN